MMNHFTKKIGALVLFLAVFALLVPAAVMADDWDDILDEFEEFMDEYLEIVEEYGENPSDFAVIQDYMELTEDYQEFLDELYSAESDMSRRQLRRFEKMVKEYSEELEALMY